jgi:large subunit ribosomal protein L32
MAVPKRRVSPARRGKRRSHHHLKPKQNSYCNRCGNPVLPHAVCWNCGWSNVQGREMIVVEKEEEK